MGDDMEAKRIHMHFHPPQDGSPWAVEKEESGARRRYLEGISSGLEQDGHGERMTDKCIKSFQTQAESGDVLLYAGNHGSSFTEDIGLLVDSGIRDGGDWWTRYRLYDEADGIGGATLDAADKVWRQINGLPPYSKPQARGFSVEGDIPDGGLRFVDQSGRRVMDEVALDGVWLVKRPSYRSSVAHAVAKAIGIAIPGTPRRSLAGILQAKADEAEARRDFFDTKYRLDESVDCEVERIAKEGAPDIREQLDALFREYADLLATLVLENRDMYTGGGDSDAVEAVAVYKAEDDENFARVGGVVASRGDVKAVRRSVSAITTELLHAVQLLQGVRK